MSGRWTTVDGNRACASVAYQQFFDGFRTSRETSKIEALDEDMLPALADRSPVADAERVIIVMRSGSATVRATVARLGAAATVGVLTVALLWPLFVADFVAALPSTCRATAVLLAQGQRP